jgi:hypothetical protein
MKAKVQVSLALGGKSLLSSTSRNIQIQKAINGRIRIKGSS